MANSLSHACRQADLSCLINDAQAANIVSLVRNNSTADKSYQLEWRRLREFIDEERDKNNIPTGEKYLTQENVDLFFSERASKYSYCCDGFGSTSRFSSPMVF
jgi:hypothetical protein